MQVVGGKAGDLDGWCHQDNDVYLLLRKPRVGGYAYRDSGWGSLETPMVQYPRNKDGPVELPFGTRF